MSSQATDEKADSGLKSTKNVSRPGDKIFKAIATGAGILILATLAAVAIFLVLEAWPAISAAPEDVRGGEGLLNYIGPLAFGTVLAATLALLVAFPLSIGIAIFITHYAPRKMATALGFLVDLLAAVPSIIYGLWGFFVLAPATLPIAEFLNTYLGFIPLYAGEISPTGRTMFTIGIVLGIMILPIMTAINRETFIQTPRLQEEASLALGATKWEMIRLSVIPYGKAGVISGAMLGLGRALGETMAVAIILSPSARYTLKILTSENPNTIAADIALNFPESFGVASSTLVAAGLVLFVITLVVNMLARWIVAQGGPKE